MIARLLVLLALAPLAAFAQKPAPVYGCDSPESKQLDFWLGDWTTVHSGGKGQNRVVKTLNDCVVLETFSGAPGTKLDGISISTYDKVAKKWRQTWEDNTGTYFDFEGGIQDGKFMFWREAEDHGKKFQQRMVFQDVTKDRINWLWQTSIDGGKTWKTTWNIIYARNK
jgi:hypothetical protein